MTEIEKIESIIRHINLVRENAIVIAKKLIKLNKSTTALNLLENVYKHDSDKFSKFTFDNLWFNAEKFEDALTLHRKNNEHHLEYWDGKYENIPEEVIAEMICDVTARAQEFGTDIRSWVEINLYPKFNARSNEKALLLNYYLDLLLTAKFY